MMTAFNTLEYSNKIKASGIDPKAAEAISLATAEVLENLIINRLATKEDLKILEKNMQAFIIKTAMYVVGILGGLITILGGLQAILHFSK